MPRTIHRVDWIALDTGMGHVDMLVVTQLQRSGFEAFKWLHTISLKKKKKTNRDFFEKKTMKSKKSIWGFTNEIN